ncbi:uncharacterized protein LOC122672133 [Telopea speciosissima]|uniref:uncharacterized protein LOC122672133 n=1 Tax=Telopea speciosissima TaxID=54955 RepID=UPI001CC5E8DD|nr:uncharacterized protein LOC122672133 [Telopea speciosissima]
MGNEAIFVEEAKKWLQELGRRRFNQDIQYISLQGLQIVQAQRDSILFNQILHKELADRRGNCHVGAIASIIDAVGATAIATYTGDLKVSVDFNISYFSTVKIEVSSSSVSIPNCSSAYSYQFEFHRTEEVEIEAKVVAHTGKLSLTTVEFRRKKDGVVVALGKQWMSQINAIPGLQSLRTRL